MFQWQSFGGQLLYYMLFGIMRFVYYGWNAISKLWQNLSLLELMEYHHPYWSILSSIWFWWDKEQEIRPHVFRKANMITNYLASMVHFQDIVLHLITTTPLRCSLLLTKDIMGLSLAYKISLQPLRN